MATKKRSTAVHESTKAEASANKEVVDLAPPPTNNAKRQMTSIFVDEPPAAPVRHIRANRGGDSNSTALCKVQGVVTRARDDVVQGPKGPIQKKRIDIIVTGVMTNHAQDIIKTGVEGEVFLFPSKQVDTAEAAEQRAGGLTGNGGDKYASKVRELLVSPMQHVRKLSTFSSSFYKDTKDGGAAGVCAAEPGALVEIEGVCVNAVTRMGNVNFYLNGGKVTCLQDRAPTPGVLARNMIMLCNQPHMQEWSAFAASIPMKGFFDAFSKLNSAQKQQALVCQANWTRLVESTADRLKVMAEGKDEGVAAQLNAHEQRVRATPAAKVANGDMSLFLIDQYDSTIAPVVQQGLAPWQPVPELIRKLEGSPEEQATLPNTFTAPWVVNVEVTNKALCVDMRVAYIFDKNQAFAAFDEGAESPMLVTSTAALSMTLSMRDVGVKFGSLRQDKLQMACTEVIPTSTFAAFPKISAVEQGGQAALKTEFPEGGTLYIDMQLTLKVHTVLVGEAFIKTCLCSGGTQFVPPKVGVDVPKFEFPPGVVDMPDLAEYKYEEITTSSFDMENWGSLGAIEYRVLYAGAKAALKNDPSLASDSGKGEAYLKGLQVDDKNATMKSFLTGNCLVYAVLA